MLFRRTIPRLSVDLSEPANLRWRGLQTYANKARELTDSYVKDLGGTELFGAMLSSYADAFVSRDVREEVRSIAALIGKSEEEVLIANLYYDAFRALMGCTAFSIDTLRGPIHARNLDWWTERNILSKHTLITEVRGAPAGPYSSVGWPGFVGVFSGMAPDRFAITLNAVLSNETPSLAPSIALVLREVFETCADFDEAAYALTERPIAADCLLLLTGTQNGERVVIERTSTRASVRTQPGGPLIVTNDYRVLQELGGSSTSELHQTSCDRFDRALYLASDSPPDNAHACFAILGDAKVKMAITVQQMVMQPSTGLLEVRLP